MIDRAYMSAHVGRQQREREIRTTTAPIGRQRLGRAQRLDSLGTVAIFAVPAAWYVFNLTAAVLVGLVFSAACLTVWVQLRRQP